MAETENYKVAIMTGTTTQGEEELRAAQREQAADPEHIITDTYPDSFMAEQETTISKLVAFAADPEVKAIVMCQAVPGAKAAFDKIREMGRDDILLIVGTPQEDPAVIAPPATSQCTPTRSSRATPSWRSAPSGALTCSSTTPSPATWPMELIVGRHELLKANAEALGIEFVDVTAPTPPPRPAPPPPSSSSVRTCPSRWPSTRARRWPSSPPTASCRSPFRPPSCPSPTPTIPALLPQPLPRLPGGLGLEFGDDVSDEDALKAVAAALNAYDAAGRYSTWPSPVAMSIIKIGVEYARQYINGQITERNDKDALQKLFDEALGALPLSFTPTPRARPSTTTTPSCWIR